MRAIFTPPQFADAEKTHQARQLYIILWALILAFTIGETGAILALPDAAGRWMLIIVVIDSFCLGLITLTRHGHTRLASNLSILGLWVIAFVYASTAGGIRAPATYFYMVIVFIAGILLGTRTGFITAVGCSLSGLVLVVAKSIGILPAISVQNTDFTIWITIIINMVIIIGLQYLASSSIKQSFRQMQQELVERKQAEQALRESENRYSTLAGATFEGIVITQNGLIIDANPQLAKMLGFSLPEVFGSQLSSFVRPEDKTQVEDVLASGEEKISEHRIQRKDGSEIYIESHGQVFEINQQQVRMTSVRDITERKRVEEELQHEAERSKALARISTRFTNSLDLHEVLNTICEEIARVLETPVTSIWLVGDTLQFHQLKAVFGLSAENISQVQPIPNRIHPLWQKKLENIYYVADVQEIEDNNNGAIVRQLGFHTIVNCQLFHNGQIIGILSLFRYEKGWNYSDSDFTLLQTLTNQISIAIFNAQLYEQVKNGRVRLQALSEKLVDIQEAERRHLAIELHDEIGQVLTHIKLSLDRFDPTQPEQTHLESALEMTSDLIKRVRGLSLELRPTILDDLGLLPTVIWHVDRYTSQTGIQVDLKHSGVNMRFRPQIESTAYRILQESLTNVARHAGATRVKVILWANEEHLELQVEDNGIGFDPTVALQNLSSGLSGMQERANVCGGQLVIDSQPGQGTSIMLELPLQGEYVERRER